MRIPLSTACLVCFCLLRTDAIAQPRQATYTPPIVSLEVERVEPAPPVEGRPLHIYFSIINRSQQVRSGWVSADVGAGNDCTRFSDFWRITDLPPGGTAHGAVTATTPRAGLDRVVKLYYFEIMLDGERANNCPRPRSRDAGPPVTLNQESSAKRNPGPHLSEIQYRFSAAAKFSFLLKNYDIHNPRSLVRDTDYAGLAAALGDDFIFSSSALRLRMSPERHEIPFEGYLSNFGLVTQFETGPIQIIPGLSPRLTVAYTMYNMGDDSREAEFMRELGQATTRLIRGADSGTTPVRQISSDLKSYFGGCDGPVVADIVTLNSADMDTEIEVAQFNLRDFTGPEYRSQVGCGQTPNYSVRWLLTRLREDDSLRISPPTATVYAGQTVAFQSQHADVDWNVETVGTGSIVNGLYTPPEHFAPNQLVVIRATERSPRRFSYGATLRTATAFVNLQKPKETQGGVVRAITRAEITVPANVLWVDTGFTLGSGQELNIRAAGQWSNTGPPLFGPDGLIGTLYPGTVLETANLGALIAKVGEKMFYVGGEFMGTSPATGTLYLAINDTPPTYGDNEGELQVTIWVR